jgi:Uma2 family endonuclease
MLPEDGHRYEIVDGGLYVSPPPSMGHQLAASELALALRLAAPTDIAVLEGIGIDFGRSTFIPDIAVIPRDVAGSGAALAKPSDVRLVVEIVSPSSVSMDRFLKRARYAQAGIPSYWRVEFDRSGEPSIVVHDLDGDGYREIVIGAGERVEVERPFPVVLAPAGLVGPRA